LVVGGRNNSVDGNQNLNLEIFNLEYSEWYRLQPIPRFRHTTWISDLNLYIHGGFDPAQPNIPTSDLYKIDLEQALGGVSGLNNQLNFQGMKAVN
jgi:protein phosphatase